jgi:hypothetical protein
MRESDLYAPIRDWLIQRDYQPKAEVEDMDIMALKGDTLLVVELKNTLNLEVILQAVDRQRLADIVYIGVPKKGKVLFTKRWRLLVHLLKRLELGLLLVSFMEGYSYVEEAVEPTPFDRNRSRATAKKRKARALTEYHKRLGDQNIGGVSKTKLMTAYRENALLIAYHLSKQGPLTPKKLRALGTGPKTTEILYHNFYGWFSSVKRGVYALTEEGSKALAQYHEYIHILEEAGGVYETEGQGIH